MKATLRSFKTSGLLTQQWCVPFQRPESFTVLPTCGHSAENVAESPLGRLVEAVE